MSKIQSKMEEWLTVEWLKLTAGWSDIRMIDTGVTDIRMIDSGVTDKNWYQGEWQKNNWH